MSKLSDRGTPSSMSKTWSLVLGVLGAGALGAISGALGFPLTSWQYWAFTIPAAVVLSLAWRHPRQRRQNSEQ